MNTEELYRLGICLEASRIAASSIRQTNFRRTALYHCREAQNVRRQIREIA